MAVHTCKPSPEEADEGDSKFQASVGYIDPVPKKEKLCASVAGQTQTFPATLLCICHISIAVIGCPDKNNLKKKGFGFVHSFQPESITAGKAWWQEGKTAGHTVSVFRKQGEIHVGAQIAFSGILTANL